MNPGGSRGCPGPLSRWRVPPWPCSHSERAPRLISCAFLGLKSSEFVFLHRAACTLTSWRESCLEVTFGRQTLSPKLSSHRHLHHPASSLPAIVFRKYDPPPKRGKTYKNIRFQNRLASKKVPFLKKPFGFRLKPSQHPLLWSEAFIELKANPFSPHQDIRV